MHLKGVYLKNPKGPYIFLGHEAYYAGCDLSIWGSGFFLLSCDPRGPCKILRVVPIDGKAEVARELIELIRRYL